MGGLPVNLSESPPNANDQFRGRSRQDEGNMQSPDGSVALVEFGAAGEISSHSAQEPIIGFIFSNKGLMYKLTFEGSKMTRLDR